MTQTPNRAAPAIAARSTRRRFIAATAGLAGPWMVPRQLRAAGEAGAGLDADVIIIGAGLAGLNAALLLEEFGVRVMVVEATSQFGGRMHTVADSIVPGYPELGANGIGGGYARVLNAAARYGVEIGPMRPRTEPRAGEMLFCIQGQLISEDDWPSHALNPYRQEWARAMPPSRPPYQMYAQLNPFPESDLGAWRRPEFSEWDRSVGEVLTEAGLAEAGVALGAGLNSGYGTDHRDLSALMMFHTISFALHQANWPNAGGAAIGGNQRIPEAMARNLTGDVLLNSPVAAIAGQNDRVQVTLRDGRRLNAARAVIAIPFAALQGIAMDPEPPPAQKAAIGQLGYTPCTQIHYAVKQPYWEQDGKAPSMWTDALPGRFMALKNDTGNPDAVTSCLAYVNGRSALKLAQMDEQDAIAEVTAALGRLRPSLKQALEPIYFWKWSNNPYAGGAYAYWKPGQITDFAATIAQPHGRIHFAGEHTAELNRGMEGAMESGERAALELLDYL
ncbi:flavin monoamine oxidase family protein [Candidatus Foliamicus sp.]